MAADVKVARPGASATLRTVETPNSLAALAAFAGPVGSMP